MTDLKCRNCRRNLYWSEELDGGGWLHRPYVGAYCESAEP
jgi:hypothetical protein